MEVNEKRHPEPDNVRASTQGYRLEWLIWTKKKPLNPCTTTSKLSIHQHARVSLACSARIKK